MSTHLNTFLEKTSEHLCIKPLGFTTLKLSQILRIVTLIVIMEHSDFNNQIAKFEDSLEQERVEYNSEETSPNRTSSVESWDNLSGKFKSFKKY